MFVKYTSKKFHLIENSVTCFSLETLHIFDIYLLEEKHELFQNSKEDRVYGRWFLFVRSSRLILNMCLNCLLGFLAGRILLKGDNITLMMNT